MRTVYMREHFYTAYPVLKRFSKNYSANESCSYHPNFELRYKGLNRKLTEPDYFFTNMIEDDLMQSVYEKDISREFSRIREYPEDSWAKDRKLIQNYPMTQMNDVENLSKFPRKIGPENKSLSFYRVFGVQKPKYYGIPMTAYEEEICYPAILQRRLNMSKINGIPDMIIE